MKKIILLIGLFISAFAVTAQSIYAPLNADYYHLIDRADVLNKNFSESVHTSFKPYRAVDIVATIDSADFLNSAQDQFNAKFIKTDHWEYWGEDSARSKKSFLKKIYRTRADFLHVNTKDFKLRVNPILYLSGGRDSNSGSTPFINTRGVQIRGSIDDKIGFYSTIEESQAVFPKYVQDYTTDRGVVPNEAFWKKYGEHGVDFFTARGYFTFNASKHIALQFGYDKNFVGNGYRSMLLSDFSAPSTFLKIQTKVWRIQYTNLYTELIADAPYSSFGSNGTEEFPKKFMTSHHLSINITDNLNIGVFEAIIFNRGDSTGSAFEWNYLNPIIFYRSIEQYTGSPDNALFGIDWKWNIAKGVQFYGQGLLDEMVISELKAGNGWWGNKFSVQLGGKYYNAFGIKNLDLQAEYNVSRPFTYSHESIFTNFAHYRQPLAHPLGANFKEGVFIARYQPILKLYLSSKFIISQYGTDPGPNINLGADVLKDYTTRTQEYNNEIGQGVSNDQLYLDLTASYMLKHNLFIDLRHVYRDRTSGLAELSSTTNFTSIAIRLNVAAREQSF
ncbi:MAG: hypothetical protein ABJH98_19055 [Reichenbachiella sp.]|uniref:hypothetical protein n=1 Tax=Reichenbachiella sp. TaxID=2184521 RepID=UPI003297DDF1